MNSIAPPSDGVKTESGSIPAIPVLTLLFISAVAALIRWPGLFSTPVDLDEGYTVLTARLGLIEPVLRGPCDRNPLGAHLPHALWSDIGGLSQSSLELVSYFAGIAIIPFVYLLGRELFSHRTGLVAAALVSVSTFHIFYSQYIRVYSTAVLISVSALLYFTRWYRCRRPKDGINSLLLSAIAVNLHYYAALSVGSVLVFLCGAAIKDKTVRKPAVLAGITILAAAFPTLLWQSRVLSELNEPTWMAPPGLKTFASIWFHLSSQSIGLTILFLSLLVLAFYRIFITAAEKWPPALLFTGIFCPIAAALVFSLGHGSVFHLRYFIFILVPFLILIAEGLGQITPRLLQVAVTAAVGIFSILALMDEIAGRGANPAYRTSPLRSASVQTAAGDLQAVTIFSSKCGFVSAEVENLVRGQRYLLRSADDTWVLKCIAGAGIEINHDSVSRFQKFMLINQGCPPAPARVELCLPDAFSAQGFTRTAVWDNGAVCEFSK